MTLLSIREQEAVQQAVSALQCFGCSHGWKRVPETESPAASNPNLYVFAQRFVHDPEGRQNGWLDCTRDDAKSAIVVSTVILATRDAIARQVREKARRDTLIEARKEYDSISNRSGVCNIEFLVWLDSHLRGTP